MRTASSSLRLETQRQYFRDPDLRPIGHLLLDASYQPFPVQPGAVHAGIDDAEASPRRIAPHPEMLARDFVVGVKSQVNLQIVTAPSDRDLVAHHQVELRTGIIFIADFGMNAIRGFAGFLRLARSDGV